MKKQAENHVEIHSFLIYFAKIFNECKLFYGKTYWKYHMILISWYSQYKKSSFERKLIRLLLQSKRIKINLVLDVKEQLSAYFMFSTFVIFKSALLWPDVSKAYSLNTRKHKCFWRGIFLLFLYAHYDQTQFSSKLRPIKMVDGLVFSLTLWKVSKYRVFSGP